MLLAGPLFPPKEYGNEGRVWDDAEFFNQMVQKNGNWSPKQEELIFKRFAAYEKEGFKLNSQARQIADAPLASQDIPF